MILIQNALDGKVGKGNQIDMNGARIINLGNPIGKDDAVSQRYLVSEITKYVPISGGFMRANLSMGGNKITHLGYAVLEGDATSKKYVDSKQQNFSHLSANYDNLVSFSDVKNIFLSRKETFPMEAGLDMGNHQIYNVKDPTVDDQGVNMRFVNIRFSQFAANPTLGETNLSGEKIVNLATPTNDDDASNKNMLMMLIKNFETKFQKK